MQLVLSISPPQSLRKRYVHFQSSCLHKNTSYKSILHNTVDTGLRVLFADIMFTKLRGLPTSEKSCQFNVRSITFTTTSL